MIQSFCLFFISSAIAINLVIVPKASIEAIPGVNNIFSN
ncbi:hypothetical protein DFH76_003009 [Clostridium beijerinckii]|nr:hypothetical protein [Clostridium beijerinckii]